MPRMLTLARCRRRAGRAAVLLGSSVTKTTTKAMFQGKPVELATLKNAQRRRGPGDQLRRDHHVAEGAGSKPARSPTSSSASIGRRSTGPIRRRRTSASIVGRYGNRIAKGQFALGGKTYKLATNNGPNHLHGGNRGFDKVLWDMSTKNAPQGSSVIFTRTSPDGEEGYPGQPARDRDLHADREERADRRLPRDDRQGDAGQPDAAQLLQPGRRRLRRHPRPPADASTRTATRRWTTR